MAKGMKSGTGKMKTRTVGGPAMRQQQGKVNFPNQGLPSNPIADQQSRWIFTGGLLATFLVIAAGVFWCVTQIMAGLTGTPNYVAVAAGFIGIVVLALVSRAGVWMSIFGALMFAQKNNGWEGQKYLTERAMKLKKLIPGGATTAALLLIQGYISRGEVEETIRIGEQQYAEFGKDPKQTQNLAPMYSTLGLAFHMQGQWRDSILWNERAIEAFDKILDQFENKKGFMAKLAGAQGQEWSKEVRKQLAVIYFNNGTNHFNLRNHLAAKDNYRKAVEQANLAPDFPEKPDLLKVSKEQLSRLKHV